jgi:AraC-like DNA-binding protein
MKPSLDLLVILNFLGAAQALLLAVVLFSIQRGNRTANRYLASFAAVIAISIGGVTLGKTPYISLLPHLSKLHQPFYFLGAPLLFLYVRALILRKQALQRADLLHFVPFVLCALYMVPYYLQSGADKLNSRSAYYGVPWFGIRSALLLLQFFVYLTLIAFMLVSYSRKTSGRELWTEKTIRFQVRFLLITFMSLWAVGLLHYAASLVWPAYYNTPETDLIIPLGITVFVYALAYLALKKPETLTGIAAAGAAKKYERSSMTPERSEKYVQKLLHFMETNKPYTDGDLTLRKLAKKLSIPPQYLSRVINERLNQSFVDFINTYRVEEAKKSLLDPAKKHYSLLAIAEDVGFNSKSSFNLVFKKHTNMTPSSFRKANNMKG